MATPNSISPETWEEMRDQISDLYRNDDWPLKQVIKKLRKDNFNPSETQLRSKLKKWRVTKPSRRSNKKTLVEKSTSDLKPTSFEEDEADPPLQPAAAEHPIPHQDPQSASTDWTTSDIYASPTNFQPSVPPTTYSWEPNIGWQGPNFKHAQRTGELYENHAAGAVQNDCIPVPSPIRGTHPPMLIPYSPAASTWSSSLEAPLHPSNLMLQPNVITPPNVWMSPTTAQTVDHSYAQQAQPLDNSYSQQTQPSPTASQYPRSFHGPSDPSLWSEESLEEFRPSRTQWRSSYDIPQGNMEATRVKREQRFRIHHNPKPTTVEYADASHRINDYSSSYDPDPPGQNLHLNSQSHIMARWPEMNGTQPDGQQSQLHLDLHHSHSVYQ